MLEHVGVTHYKTYFQQVANMLEPDGTMLLHCVMRNTPPSLPSSWLLKYIFPGGYAPALSEVVPEVERAGLKMTDIEIWRGHYAKTIHEWRLRTIANADRIIQMYDAKFLRMWLYYLNGTEAVFYYGNQCNMQVQLSHSMFNPPVTRDYMQDAADKRTITPPF
jgi:cyclopropane-fatty-acyl-phospholipid synthase